MKLLFRLYQAYMVTALGSMLVVLYASWIYVKPLSSLLSSAALGVALAAFIFFLRSSATRQSSPAVLREAAADPEIREPDVPEPVNLRKLFVQVSENSQVLCRLEQKIQDLENGLASVSQEVERVSGQAGMQTVTAEVREQLQAEVRVEFERIKRQAQLQLAPNQVARADG